MATTPAGAPTWTRGGTIDYYGGTLDKRGSILEADESYMGMAFRALQDLTGSAYTKLPGTIVHAKQAASARLSGHTGWRLPEKRVANSTPLGADEKLPRWVELLAVRVFPSDTEEDVRRKATAKYEVFKGNTSISIDNSLRTLLGSIYVDTIRNYGTDLNTVPTSHFWPVINPGPASLNLGNGTWMSHIGHISVTVTRPADGNEEKFQRLMDVEFFDFMDSAMPVWATFAWSIVNSAGDDVGFLLDVSLLDTTPLGP